MQALNNRSAPLRILCLEAHPLQRKLLSACVQLIDGQVLFAADGNEVVALFRAHPVDLILLDMNKDDGFATLNRIRLSGLRGKAVPVIAVSENVTRMPESAYCKLGFSALYEKPVEPYRLLNAIDSSLIAAGQKPLFLAAAG